MTKDEALQIALDALKQWKGFQPEYWEEKDENSIEAIRTALAQPEPKNKPLTHEENKAHNQKILDEFYKENVALYEPEPVAWMQDGKRNLLISDEHDAYHTVPLYTALPKREWVALTDEDIYAIQYTDRPFMFARAIEAKLKEKNA